MMDDKTYNKLIDHLNKLEQSCSNMRMLIEGLNKDKAAVRRQISIKEDPKFKQAVIDGLKAYFKRQDELYNITNLSCWIRIDDLRQTLIDNELYSINILKDKLMNIKIGITLTELGFIESKRDSYGKLRLIDKDKLDRFIP